MFAKEADKLKQGDKVITFNGPYQQNAIVVRVEKDYRGIRWITYTWRTKENRPITREKRHVSVYLPVEKGHPKTYNPDPSRRMRLWRG